MQERGFENLFLLSKNQKEWRDSHDL
ncbi:hypothetical protein SHANETTE_83 [Bacillus phage Shanette]|uniref:Uncharacterized protein n=1 Tax=Bacillus phage Shanette TaxID=1296656 RepID=S5MT93_9CAUD|nr:hypothetical protein AVV46_gp214 [Bacillus phage Shanette]AGR46977.1 hypothetical protein SHANETTE_83 [Bacillus phage Shanette]